VPLNGKEVALSLSEGGFGGKKKEPDHLLPYRPGSFAVGGGGKQREKDGDRPSLIESDKERMSERQTK